MWKATYAYLIVVRRVSPRVDEPDSARCVSAGVDVLLRAKLSRVVTPVTRVRRFFLENDLSLPTSDKEGGFMFLPLAYSFKEKALQAIDASCNRRNDVSLVKVKKHARKLCWDLGLARSIERKMHIRHVLFCKDPQGRVLIKRHYFRTRFLAEACGVVFAGEAANAGYL